MDTLKLIALDKEDLEVLSAHLQDAVVIVGEIVWLPAEKRLVIPLCRFDWEGAVGAGAQYRRRRAALRFERVNSFKARQIDPALKGAVLNLLVADFAESEPPSGHVTLTFSGGPALRLDVECLEVELADIGPSWDTGRCPDHPIEGLETQG
jgi:hypothetical protein